MKVSYTKNIEEIFGKEIIKLIANEFAKWKSSDDEFSSYFFGKDGAYSTPKLSFASLRHVHTPPSDELSLRKWKKDDINKSRKTSDSVLIYVQASGDNFLLIHHVKERAHETANDKKFMAQLGNIAQKFVDDGDIIF